MAKFKADQPDKPNKGSTQPDAADSGNSETSEGPDMETCDQNTEMADLAAPIGLLLKLATDDNVETSEGVEVKVGDARSSTDNALLTKNELQIYDDFKKQWQEALARPQEALDALARREQQIIEAAARHDWETLDRLQKEVEKDLQCMQYVFDNFGLDRS